jgi:hypothetical protein
MGVRGRRLDSWPKDRATGRFIRARAGCGHLGVRASSPIVLFLALLLFASALPLAGREKDKLPYGEGLIVNIPVPESEVEQVVEEMVQNGIIRGTKEYNKDEFVSGAKAASSCRVFPPWKEGGRVFYKVREQAIDPRNFKDSTDVGTLAVRYVVKPQGGKNTVLRIDALFEEDFRHIVHQSDGSVEGSEYKDIQEHIDAIEVMKKQNVEAEEEREEQQRQKKQKAAIQTYAPTEIARQSSAPPSGPEAVPQAAVPKAATQPAVPQPPVPQATESQAESSSPAGATQSPGQTLSSQSLPGESQPGQTLEEHVKDLRKQLERLVKAPGAPLKSAPFHTASTLQTLTTGTEVLLLISTPYWYGVETHEGQHGWIMRDQLEQP